MRTANQYLHLPFLKKALTKLLPQDSFANRFKRSIGAELEAQLDLLEEGGDSLAATYPVGTLFVFIARGGGVLDPEWLRNEDRSFVDDEGIVMCLVDTPVVSGSEQLAAYGLYLLDELNSCGPSEEKDWDEHRINSHGWSEIAVCNHKAGSLLLAYQALSYAERLLLSKSLTSEENEAAALFDFSKIGKAGAAKRHAPMAELRKWAVTRYREGVWSSANEAAHELKESIINYGRTINAHLKEQNAQRTIAEWFRKSV